MTDLRGILAGIAAAAWMAAVPAWSATLVTFGDPWGQKSTLEAAMDGAFGAGGWADVTSPVGTGFLAGESYVYMDGSDRTTNAMEAYLAANETVLQTWMSAGGSLFINAAPNEGDGLAFDALTLNFSRISGDVVTDCRSRCVAANASNTIFSGLTATDFTGTAFSHATVTGGSVLIRNALENEAILSERNVDSGYLMMGGMTTLGFHTFGEAQELRQNILAYGAARGSLPPPDPVPVPLPAGVTLLLAGLGGFAACARRKAAT